MPAFPTEDPDFMLRKELVLRLIGDTPDPRLDPKDAIDQAEALLAYIKRGKAGGEPSP